VAYTVYQNADLSVGANWLYSTLTGIQDFLIGASLVRFNVASLSGKTIDSATLELEVSYTGVGYYPRQWCVRAMATSWSPTTVTWNVIESSQYYTGSQINQNPPTYGGQIYDINVKTIVQNWASGAWSNYGLFFTSLDYTFPYATSYDAFAFYSLEDGGQGWPKLIVTYH